MCETLDRRWISEQKCSFRSLTRTSPIRFPLGTMSLNNFMFCWTWSDVISNVLLRDQEFNVVPQVPLMVTWQLLPSGVVRKDETIEIAGPYTCMISAKEFAYAASTVATDGRYPGSRHTPACAESVSSGNFDGAADACGVGTSRTTGGSLDGHGAICHLHGNNGGAITTGTLESKSEHAVSGLYFNG